MRSSGEDSSYVYVTYTNILMEVRVRLPLLPCYYRIGRSVTCLGIIWTWRAWWLRSLCSNAFLVRRPKATRLKGSSFRKLLKRSAHESPWGGRLRPLWTSRLLWTLRRRTWRQQRRNQWRRLQVGRRCSPQTPSGEGACRTQKKCSRISWGVHDQTFGNMPQFSRRMSRHRRVPPSKI